MKITVQHILELIDTLEKGVPFDYVKPGGNKAVLVSVDFEKKEVSAKRVSEDGNEQSVKFIEANLELIENDVVENKPFSMDKVFNNGGNARSVIEALLARTAEFHACWINRHKHLVWIPSKVHDAGAASVIEVKDIPAPVYVKPANTMQTIYFGTPGSGKSHTVREKVKEFNGMLFRTTFHPDTDYASFVGSYKPVVKSTGKSIPTDYTQKQLADLLKKEYAEAADKVTALLSFSLRYVGYFNGTIAKFSKKEFLTDANLSESYSAEITKMVNLYDWLVESGMVSESNVISYEFVPQAFTDAYVEAWKDTDKPVFLVIEEINRGNCAQIFGDLFQLLDRDKNGYSEYSIQAEADLKKYLDNRLGEDQPGIADGKLRLPSNFHILATMNTSDQSLFPMDSAFKRRWDWEYVPIEPENPKSQFTISIGDKNYDWKSFLTAANDHIKEVSESEDKQMGNFFIKDDIKEKDFVSKVMFYIWSEVCKDEYRARSFFHYKDGNNDEFSFNQLFKNEGGKTVIDTGILQGFMNFLGVPEK